MTAETKDICPKLLEVRCPFCKGSHSQPNPWYSQLLCTQQSLAEAERKLVLAGGLAEAVRRFSFLRAEWERQCLARLNGVEIDPTKEIQIDGQANAWKECIAALAAYLTTPTKEKL